MGFYWGSIQQKELEGRLIRKLLEGLSVVKKLTPTIKTTFQCPANTGIRPWLRSWSQWKPLHKIKESI
jgi:hypothetical protein